MYLCALVSTVVTPHWTKYSSREKQRWLFLSPATPDFHLHYHLSVPPHHSLNHDVCLPCVCVCGSQERAAKWRTSDGLMDGLTTNGVLVMHPAGEFVSEPAPGVWREISVCGNVFALRETRSAQQRGKLVRFWTGKYDSFWDQRQVWCRPVPVA